MTHLQTDLIHPSYQPPSGFAAPQGAVHKASTVIFSSVAAMRSRDWKNKDGYTYGLHGTPSTFALEEKIAQLEGAKHCVLVPSGLAAVALMGMAFCTQGGEMLLPSNVYGPSVAFAQNELKAWGVTARFYDPMQPQTLVDGITPSTQLVWLEAPGSVTMEFSPIDELAAICRARGVVSALDNTWGAGLAFNGFDLLGDGKVGADVVVQALTKFPSGGGDVLMGSVCTRDDALALRIKATHMRTGYGVGANDVELVARSLPTLAMRYDAQDASGRHLAQWLATQPQIAQVLHPALPSGVGHAHWQRLCAKSNRAAGLFSVIFDARYSQAQIDRFCDSLKLFKLGFSWAGPMSLVAPYDMSTLRSEWPMNGVQAGCLVRFSLGFEAVEDLQADLARALAAV